MSGVFDYLGDSTHWSGTDGIPNRLLEHLQYSFGALVLVLLIALPLGLYVGHTGRGALGIAGVANALRALPTFGLLVILGVPAVLANTYAGVQSVDPAARDAARGMGMTGWQVLWRVEVPNALPLIISGVRSSILQIVATATIAAYVSLGGLGRYIIDGLSQRDYAQMASGALLVAILALLLDLVLAVAQRFVVSPGVTGRFQTGGADAVAVRIPDGNDLVTAGRTGNASDEGV
jgi:osmoprotectant transport system permease protein